MKKLSLYLDVFPGMLLEPDNYFSAHSQPSDKTEGWKRYRIDFEIPDPKEPDAIVDASAVEEA